jgi:pyruvate-ferredoxin/flavodoxin oxidoreductase
MGENFQMSYANGELTVFGDPKIAIETEGEHSAQGGAIAVSVTGKRVVNFTSGQGIVYGCEQYYHAPGKLSTMVLQVSARALTRSALNVHCGHDDIYAVLDTGWTILFGKDAQQAADQSLILRKVNELALNPGINVQDGFLTSHLERTFLKCESDLIREYLGRPDDIIDCPSEAQKELFGPKRRRIPIGMDLKNPMLLGPVQNQEHYMNGVIARRNNFTEQILDFLEEAYEEFATLTGRRYGLISEYNCQGADTVFVALGSAAENCEAAVDHIKKRNGEQVGIIHLNVVRPFPEATIVKALKGKKRVIILERSDDQLAGDNPIARDIRTAFTKALSNTDVNAFPGIPAIQQTEIPRIFSGVYGLGSRDFRPEGILGAYEFATGKIARQDGTTAKDTSFFYVGVNHPYAVISQDKPSLLPEHAIAIRLHSIGGWGMITTGKNLGEIMGEISNYIVKRDQIVDESGKQKELYHISANPKYGSEKKGAPTNYFMVAAPERIRINCDLQHVNTVICCDPKAFTHTNPLEGLTEHGALIMETSEGDSQGMWQRIPRKHRQEIIDKKIRIFGLRGFEIAHRATDRQDLQFRMQGNAFLGAFFKVSDFLDDNKVPDDEFLSIVAAQYEKKFGRFGKAVVSSNMQVMKDGFEQVWQVEVGEVDAPDTSSMRGESLVPVSGRTRFDEQAKEQPVKIPLATLEKFDSEFRAGYGYHQPASALASTGVMAAATAATTSKYVSRRMVPIFHPERCTQCMDCIISCPDTAMPNTAQDISTILETAIKNYIGNAEVREALLANVPALDTTLRAEMYEHATNKKEVAPTFSTLFDKHLDKLVADDQQLQSIKGITESLQEVKQILKEIPVAYSKVRSVFEIMQKKTGDGGVFSIMISDHCKGCGECVVECGDKQALSMILETEEINGQHQTEINFLNLLPETAQKYLGKFDAENPAETKSAVLKNHLLVRKNYDAITSGDGACAGCGEKSILRGIASITEAYMRPLYKAKADRLENKAKLLQKNGAGLLAQFKEKNEEAYRWWSNTVKHIILGLGGESEADSLQRMASEFKGSDSTLIDALDVVLRQDAFNHRDLRAIDGRYANGMCTMMMSASTGCNSVYGSTHPNNPHTYPWMNSLFQDSATLAWLFGESLIADHAKRSVLPERLVDLLLSDDHNFDQDDYFRMTHFSDYHMTDQEIAELPKVWAVGGDGALGDIGFQNLSKVILQNRPNVHVLLLDTQVYSNTGGQNSDSSVMPGGFDMNQFGAASEGKITERKEVATLLTTGHGSAYIAQVSMANSANYYKAVLDGVSYRGSAFIQAYTSCQPEHGVADNMSAKQAKEARDSRGMPEFVSNPTLGETFQDSFSLKGNPELKRDWRQKTIPGTKDKYNFTVAHWAATEPRFRRHFFKIKAGEEKHLLHLDEKIKNITQNDVVYRRFLIKNHPSFIPKNGVYILVEQGDKMVPVGISRQLVLFCVERRKNWRMMQSKAGVVNSDYEAQKEYLGSL